MLSKRPAAILAGLAAGLAGLAALLQGSLSDLIASVLRRRKASRLPPGTDGYEPALPPEPAASAPPPNGGGARDGAPPPVAANGGGTDAAAFPADVLPAEEVTPRPHRYANVILADERDEERSSLPQGEPVELRAGIGPLAEASRVEHPEPFPDELLPKEDVELEVVLASSTLLVGTEIRQLGRELVSRRLVLPAGGGASVSVEDGAEYARFFVLREGDGGAQARLAYYYKGAPVQSQKLVIEAGTGALTVRTDYTITRTLGADLEQRLTSRPRLSVIANESAGNRHEFVVRAAGAGGATYAERHADLSDDDLAPKVEALREILAQRSPTRRARTRSDLETDLRKLAPEGWNLYTALGEAIGGPVAELYGQEKDIVVQVAVTSGNTFTLPWSFLYDIYLNEEVEPRVCESVTDEDALHKAAHEGLTRCPWEAEPWHVENVLCPFGFWGLRFEIEQLVSTDEMPAPVRLSGGPHIAVALTKKIKDRDALASHLDALRSTFKTRASTVLIREATSKNDLRTLMEVDLPVAYFLCHGSRDPDNEGTILGIGDRDEITPRDVAGWVQTRLRRDRVSIWSNPRPLIFINACESVAVTPRDLVTYAGTLIGTAHAAGVIGTEVRVDQKLAMEAAEVFFQRLLADGATVGTALRDMRLAFLADRNLFGLLYTSYASADLALTP